MKVVYIISMGHSGSTLTDLILGTHHDFISSGEMRYLGWQLERTKNKKPSVNSQDICTCERDFRECSFWSKVFEKIEDHTGIDIKNTPNSFDLAYFNKFSYKERGGYTRNFLDQVKGYLVRNWLQNGYNYKSILWLEPKIKIWLKNNWLLYECMSETADKPFVIDSSKDLTIAMLLKEFRPEDVFFLFIHRSIEGLASSAKRLALKKNYKFDLKKIIESKLVFEKRIAGYKRNLRNENYIDVDYEFIVKKPASFLEETVEKLNADKDYEQQNNDEFLIDPSKHHLIAGNPMRYKGKQYVKYDDRWKNELNEEEIGEISRCNLS